MTLAGIICPYRGGMGGRNAILVVVCLSRRNGKHHGRGAGGPGNPAISTPGQSSQRRSRRRGPPLRHRLRSSQRLIFLPRSWPSSRSRKGAVVTLPGFGVSPHFSSTCNPGVQGSPCRGLGCPNIFPLPVTRDRIDIQAWFAPPHAGRTVWCACWAFFFKRQFCTATLD